MNLSWLQQLLWANAPPSIDPPPPAPLYRSDRLRRRFSQQKAATQSKAPAPGMRPNYRTDLGMIVKSCERLIGFTALSEISHSQTDEEFVLPTRRWSENAVRILLVDSHSLLESLTFRKLT
jgi:hypothetical protein